MSTITIPKIVELVNTTRHHQIRQGHTHRFIDLMFVTVGERLFCRRYTYSEPSWRSAFIKNTVGQIKLDGKVIDVKGLVPHDLDKINPLVNKAYEEALKRYGATYLLDGAIDHRAQESTMEMIPVIT
jgi:hypothetical protein